MPRKKYDLYYTLNTHGRSTDFTPEENDVFWNTLRQLTLSQSSAVVLLIYEHFLVVRDLDTVPIEVVLPYVGKQTKRGVSFSFAAFPIELKWILFKFFEVVDGSQAPDNKNRKLTPPNMKDGNSPV